MKIAMLTSCLFAWGSAWSMNAKDSDQMRPVPRADSAIITGTANWGVRFPEDLEEEGVSVVARDLEFETPWGPSAHWKLLALDGSRTRDGRDRNVLVAFSHGWPLDEIDHEAHRRVFWVLREAGVRQVVACSTAGSLNRAILENDFVIASDVLELSQTQFSLLPNRYAYCCSGKQLICPTCAEVVERHAREIWPVDARVYGRSAALVAAHAWGPRLTSPAEVLAYRSLGGDFINHSLAPEATLAREIGACFVNCAFVVAGFDNYFHPDKKIIGAAEADLLKLKVAASRIALRAVADFAGSEGCSCSDLRTTRPSEYADRR